MKKPFEFGETAYFSELFTDANILNEEFIFKKVIAFGAFGVVVQATRNDEQDVIEKTRITSGDIKGLKEEAEILSSLNHPNVVKFQKFIQTDTHILIVMELIKAGTLKSLMMKRKDSAFPITDEEASEIMKYIFEAVQFLHSKNIVHRDLKPDNILIDDFTDYKTIKIADFGLSKSFQNSKMNLLSSKCGTLIYMAPEILSKQRYGKPIDIWSCGIIMYQLLNNGLHPIYKQKETQAEYIAKIKDPQ